MADQLINQPDTIDTGIECSRNTAALLKDQLAGYEAELLGHQRNGHPRSTLGRSFGRSESEILADMERVRQQLIQCNNIEE